MRGPAACHGLFGLLMGSTTRLRVLVGGRSEPRILVCAFIHTSNGEKRFWSEEEVKKVSELQYWSKSAWESGGLRTMFPGRTYVAVRNKWSKVRVRSKHLEGRRGARRTKWSEEEDEKIAELIRTGLHPSDMGDLRAMFPDRSWAAIRGRLYHLDPKAKPGARKAFSPEEDRLLSEARLAGQSWVYIRTLLPGRSKGTVIGRWNALQDRKRIKDGNLGWSSEATAVLLQLRHDLNLPFSAIARILKRPLHRVNDHYDEIVPPGKRLLRGRVRQWTEEEKSLARMVKDGKTNFEISGILGRSEQAIEICSVNSSAEKPRRTNNELPQLNADFNEGLSHDQVAAKCPAGRPFRVPDSMRRPGLDAVPGVVGWTKEEDSIIAEGLPIDDMESRLPGKSQRAVMQRAVYLARSRRGPLDLRWNMRWTPAEDAAVEGAIQKGLSTRQIMPLCPGRSLESISERKVLFLRRHKDDPGFLFRSKSHWSPAEDTALDNAIQKGLSTRQIVPLMPGRSYKSIDCRKRRLSRRRKDAPKTP